MGTPQSGPKRDSSSSIGDKEDFRPYSELRGLVDSEDDSRTSLSHLTRCPVISNVSQTHFLFICTTRITWTVKTVGM